MFGDNGTYDVKEIRSVLIVTHDGLIKMLINVKYVPELRRNIISPGELDRAGYSYKYEKGVMKVTKGS